MAPQLPQNRNLAVLSEIGYWRAVTEWVDGGNSDFGTCVRTALANVHTVVTTFNGNPEVMSPGEVEYGYGQKTGWSPLDVTTDRGEWMAAALDDWKNNGWPGDPMLKPRAVWSLTKERIPEGIERWAAVPAWCRLPIAGGEEPDFTDYAALNGTTVPHAVLIVGATAGWLYLVTWARVVRVPVAWWDRFGVEQFVVEHPAWRMTT